MEEASDLLVHPGDSRSGNGSADTHDWKVAFKPQFEGSRALFDFFENGFGNDVSVDGEHGGALGVLRFDLVH